MDNITKLTPEQERRLLILRDECLSVWTSCAPADRPRAEAAFARVYRITGRDPVPVIWVDSPLAASLLMGLVHTFPKENAVSPASLFGHSLANTLKRIFVCNLRYVLDEVLLERDSEDFVMNVYNSSLITTIIADSFDGDLRDTIRNDIFEYSPGDSLVNYLKKYSNVAISDSPIYSIKDAIGRMLLLGLVVGIRYTEYHAYFKGQHDINLIYESKVCIELGTVLEPRIIERLEILEDISKSCMWWYPYSKVIVACERPVEIHMDDQNRLHNDNGPAIVMRDGWKIYSVHGVRLPSWIIEQTSNITVEKIEAERNTEIQRVMIERFGWDRYVSEARFSVIDYDERWGTLRQKGDHVVLEVVNRSPEPDGSFRHYILPVSLNCEPLMDDGRFGAPQQLTALNAVASTFGMTGDEYRRIVKSES